MQHILGIQLSISTIHHYRHVVIGTNFRRCRYQPKIFTNQEKASRKAFAMNMLENWEVIKKGLLAADECKHYTEGPGIYHNRQPSSHPRAAAAKPRACKSVNIWAAISLLGSTDPVV